MMMSKSTPAANPDAYVAALDGWQRDCVQSLRKTVLASGQLDEVIKWGNIVFFANGPVVVIRAEADRVIFGFWRGRRLLSIEPRLKPGGKYEMARIEVREGDSPDANVIRQLVEEAGALNLKYGDPTAAAKRADK
jgi:hypothetical protein